MQLDELRILEALKETGVRGEALEEGSRLVDHWIGEVAELDERDETLAVEVGFYIEVAPLTFVAGTQDRIFRSHKTGKVTGSEWKTTKHETKFWNADKWFEGISNGHQVVTYATGLAYGEVLTEELIERPKGDVDIMVRAISKSHPPEIWRRPEGDLITVTQKQMNRLMSAYQNVAASIRAMRGTNRIPWEVPGIHCVNQFRKECPFLSSCRKGESLVLPTHLSTIGQSFSPGSQKVIEVLKERGLITEENWKDVVVLSASTLSTFQQCPERWRREEGKPESELEGNEAQDVGTVFHAGVGELYKQMKEQQR